MDDKRYGYSNIHIDNYKALQLPQKVRVIIDNDTTNIKDLHHVISMF